MLAALYQGKTHDSFARYIDGTRKTALRDASSGSPADYTKAVAPNPEEALFWILVAEPIAVSVSDTNRRLTFVAEYVDNMFLPPVVRLANQEACQLLGPRGPSATAIVAFSRA